MTQTTKTWLHGLAAAGITAFSTAISGALVMPETFNFSEHGMANMAKITIVPTGIAVFGYLKQSPLPAMLLEPGDKASIQNPQIAADGTITGTSATLQKAQDPQVSTVVPPEINK